MSDTRPFHTTYLRICTTPLTGIYLSPGFKQKREKSHVGTCSYLPVSDLINRSGTQIQPGIAKAREYITGSPNSFFRALWSLARSVSQVRVGETLKKT